MPVGAELIPLVKALRTSDELKDTLVFQVRNLGPVGIHSVDGVVRISGALSGQEQIVSASSKPLSAGTEVRIDE